jgi:hypothetical protein
MWYGKDVSEAPKSGFPCVEKATIEREESGNCTYGEKKIFFVNSRHSPL